MKNIKDVSEDAGNEEADAEELQVNEANPAYKMDGYYTYSDYVTWDDDQRWELIDGKAYLMSAPNLNHQSVGGEIFRQLANFLEGKKCRVFIAPCDVRLNADTLDDTVVQPDILVVCDENKLSDGKAVVGAPDLAVEVLSPSNPNHDKVLKFNKYCEKGVREFWIVDPVTKTAAVNILFDENNPCEGRYRTRIYGAADNVPVHILDGFAIDLSKAFHSLI